MPFFKATAVLFVLLSSSGCSDTSSRTSDADDDGSFDDESAYCVALSIEECRNDARCGVTDLPPWNEAGECWGPREAAGCLAINTGCGGSLDCVLDPNGKRWLTAGCAPPSWEPDEDFACQEHPNCE